MKTFILTLSALTLARAQSNEVCTSEDDFRGNDWGSYVTSTSEWTKPDTTDSSYDTSKFLTLVELLTVLFLAELNMAISLMKPTDKHLPMNVQEDAQLQRLDKKCMCTLNHLWTFLCFCRSGGNEPTFQANEPSNKRFFAAKYTCAAQKVCTSIDDFRGYEWAKYRGPNTDWTPPDTSSSLRSIKNYKS